MPIQARIFIGAVIAAGFAAGAVAAADWQCPDPPRFALFLLMAAAASSLKVRIPGMTGTITPGFAFVLLGVSVLSLPETAVLCAVSGLIQTVWKAKTRPSAVQVAFNVANLTACGALAHLVSHAAAPGTDLVTNLARLAIALLVLFLANVTAVSTVLCLLQGKPLGSIWQAANYWALPYYAAGTLVTAVLAQTVAMGWGATLLVLPALYLVHAYYVELAKRAPVAK